jgi:hypothetical protein
MNANHSLIILKTYFFVVFRIFLEDQKYEYFIVFFNENERMSHLCLAWAFDGPPKKVIIRLYENRFWKVGGRECDLGLEQPPDCLLDGLSSKDHGVLQELKMRQVVEGAIKAGEEEKQK